MNNICITEKSYKLWGDNTKVLKKQKSFKKCEKSHKSRLIFVINRIIQELKIESGINIESEKMNYWNY